MGALSRAQMRLELRDNRLVGTEEITEVRVQPAVDPLTADITEVVAASEVDLPVALARRVEGNRPELDREAGPFRITRDGRMFIPITMRRRLRVAIAVAAGMATEWAGHWSRVSSR